MSRDDLRRVAEAREHLAILRSHLTTADLDDAVVLDAVCSRLAAAIECVGAIDAEIRGEVFGSTWPAIASLRNRIARSDVRVDRATIEATVVSDLPNFDAQLDLLEGEVLHYRDSDGREIDAIVTLADGRWGAVEIKPSGRPFASGAKSLNAAVAHVDTTAVGEPAFRLVVTGTGPVAVAEDGTITVLLTALSP